MSQVDEQEYIDGVAFRWGKKLGVVREKGAQFYESFTYDNIDYTLYDCVYLYKEGEPEPYIGKLARIWSSSDKTKKVRIHWFFRPAEISNLLGDRKVLENEVFLGTGEGVGLTNANYLEAIAGKCNVVCISTDPRNPQPSEEDIKGADYLFYRTFDVGQCTISDRMYDKVGALEVKHVFNKGRDSIIGSPSLKSGKDAGKISVGSSAIVNVKDAAVGSGNKNTSGADGAVKYGKWPDVPGDQADRNGKRTLVPTTFGRNMNTLPGKNFVPTEKDLALKKGVNSEDKPPKKVRFDDFQEVDPIGSPNLMSKGKVKGLNSEDRPSKKVRLDGSQEEDDEKLTKTNQTKLHKEMYRNYPYEHRSEGHMSSISQKTKGKMKDGNSEDRPSKKVRFAGFQEVDEIGSACHFQNRKDPREETNEKLTKTNHANPMKELTRNFPAEGRSEGDMSSVSQKPMDHMDDKSRYLPLPWEIKIETERNKGAIVLLMNLDPEYTSGDVEDIIWHAFKEHCSAKVLQSTMFSIPHSAQALAIMKSNKVAEGIVKELNERCLMLSKGRPLVASILPPRSAEDKSKFVGHLTIDNYKKRDRHRRQRDEAEAVSTSHYAQPNSIEYDMGLEWKQLQASSELWWMDLFKRQAKELRNVKDKLKPFEQHK